MEIFALAVLLLAIIVVSLSIKPVPQGKEYTGERFGRYTRTPSPGLNLITP